MSRLIETHFEGGQVAAHYACYPADDAQQRAADTEQEG